VKQHLGRQSGVQNVEVSLIDGKVQVTPKEDGQIDPVQLLKATYDSGVTAAEMDVTARGKIVKDTSAAWLYRWNRTGLSRSSRMSCRNRLNLLRVLKLSSPFGASCTKNLLGKRKQTFQHC
jgi:hypothetical protein